MTLPSHQHAGGTESSVGEALGTIVARVRFWAPVWVPLIVFAQIGLLGSAHFVGFFIGCWWAPRRWRAA